MSQSPNIAALPLSFARQTQSSGLRALLIGMSHQPSQALAAASEALAEQ